MKKLLVTSFLSGISLLMLSQTTSVNIIPIPVSVAAKTGSFQLTDKTVVELASADADANRAAHFLADALSTPTGYKIAVAKSGSNDAIKLVLLSAEDKSLGNEGYKLSVATSGVTLSANKAAGLFYGAQSILQLLPKEIESKAAAKNISWTMPAVEITDYPRFGWRGLMFDVSRHFFTKQDVKQFIDDMVKYKFNLLHLHLTDDQGWRIEIKSLPKLTSVGAWNVKKTGTFGTFSTPAADEPRDFGGFYTQDDIKKLSNMQKTGL
jgi:hexosaminidase